MAISTKFLLISPLLPLTGVVQSLRSNEIECVHGLHLKKGVRIFIARFDSEDSVSEDDLTAHDEILDATLLGTTVDKHIYKLAVDIPTTLSEIFNPRQFDGGPLEPLVVTPDGWKENKLFKDYDIFNDFRTRCVQRDISVELISITQTGTIFTDDSQYGLTDRQHEALTLALSRGYYKSPRQISTAELAKELEISSTSVSELLRRGESQLLTNTLGGQSDLKTRTNQH
ncbi:helix-turn-helix domain-containing protein [Haladaptatus sp. CMAA 1911]|uniref:helix-turn-helix domain-containing protein n=1 Tax=unclassified Haladaptatus TaxID=2622732 RepID=UPI0037545194